MQQGELLKENTANPNAEFQRSVPADVSTTHSWNWGSKIEIIVEEGVERLQEAKEQGVLWDCAS